jgi:uncharacterized membrane protein
MATGLKKNTAGALSYVLGPVTGVIFLVLEKDPFVRFHAMQSIVLSIFFAVVPWILGFTIILAILVPIISILGLIVWLLCIYKAWMGEEWEVPILGKLARKLVAKA